MSVFLSALAILGGLTIAVGTLLSAMRTVVVPRAMPVRLTRWVFVCTRLGFDAYGRLRRDYAHQDRAMALYGPVSLLLMPLTWLACTTVGFASVFWGLGQRPWSQAFVVSGSSLLTLGFVRPEGTVATVVALVEAALGMSVVALLLVTYLPSIYAAFSRREQAVSLLEVWAGSPPSGVEMLVRGSRIRGLDGLDDVWGSWEAWFADLRETHTSLPAVAFFRSTEPVQSWIISAGAVLDGAALYVSCVDLAAVTNRRGDGRVRNPAAEICLRSGHLALRSIAEFFRIPVDSDPAPTDPIRVTRSEFDAAWDEMGVAGVPLVADRDAAWRAWAGWRVNYDTALIALAHLVVAPHARWSSDRAPDLPAPRGPLGHSPWRSHAPN